MDGSSLVEVLVSLLLLALGLLGASDFAADLPARAP
jgi:Tfp pilus assembly protein PilV